MTSKNILIIGEFPVIHKGYLNFFNKILADFKKANFYFVFLDKKIVKKMTKLESDIRSLSFAETKKIIRAFLPIKEIFLMGNEKKLFRLMDKIRPYKIIILKGEKSQDFAKYFLKEKKHAKLIKYYDISLRWHRKAVMEFKKEKSSFSKKEAQVYKKFMEAASKEAENSKCWWRQVGAVLVKEGKIVLRAFNKMMPTDDECYKIGCIRDEIEPGKLSEICSVTHAEASIVAAAAKQGLSLKGTTLFVTHFPCPACAKIVALSGVKKLIYSRGSAVFDGARVMENEGIKIIKI